jgi:hypothetical protein
MNDTSDPFDAAANLSKQQGLPQPSTRPDSTCRSPCSKATPTPSPDLARASTGTDSA